MTDCARPLLHYPCGSQSAGKHLGQVPGNLAEAEPFRKVHVCQFPPTTSPRHSR